MTNEEAIATLKYQYDYGQMEQDVRDALAMAIKALEQPEPCKDTISRAAAIYIASGYCHPANIAKELAKLPAVQPDVIRCKDCKHWKDSDGVYRRGYGSESKCRINHVKVQEGTFYCGMAERRTDE